MELIPVPEPSLRVGNAYGDFLLPRSQNLFNMLNKQSACSFLKTLSLCYIYLPVFFLFFTLSTLFAQNPVVKTHLTNPQYDVSTGVYTLDVEFQSDVPGQEIFGMNVRFFYPNDVLELIDFADFQGGYGPVYPNPPLVNVGSPSSGIDLFGFTEAAVFVNGAIQLVDNTSDPIVLSTAEWTKLFQLRFNVLDSGASLADFCPSVIWDMEEDPVQGGFMTGDDGVVITVVNPDPNQDSAPVTERVEQFNWDYDGIPGAPYGAPLKEVCIPIQDFTPVDMDAIESQLPRALPSWTQVIKDCVTGDIPWAYNSENKKEFIEPDLGCDDYQKDLYERPFNGKYQDEYLADIDLVRVSAAEDQDWYYFRLELFGLSGGKLKAQYSIEADTDGDGCTDWLWRVERPSRNIQERVGYDEWGKEKVTAYYDADNDVGGLNCAGADTNRNGNGYREKVNGIDENGGDFPNGLWALIPQGEGDKVVVLAVQKSMLAAKNGNVVPDFISWRAWASKGRMDQNKFHLHDEYTYQRAGDPYLSSPFFPIYNIKEVDSTNGLDNLNVFPEAYDTGNAAAVARQEVLNTDHKAIFSQAVPSEENEKLGLDLFPNPAMDFVNVRYQIPEKGGELIIYNQLGHPLYRKQLMPAAETLRFEVSSLPNGLYQMHLRVSDQVPITKRFFIIRN